MAGVLNYLSRLQWVEEIDAVGAVGTSNVVYSGYDRRATLRTDETSPAVPVSSVAYFKQDLTGGAATIDLTNLTHERGDATEIVDGTGLKVQFLRLSAPSGNSAAIEVTPGASNGYDFAGSTASIALEAGQSVLFELAESAPDISASDCEIDMAGTGTDSLEVTIIMG